MSPFPAPARSNRACGFPGWVGHRRGAGGQRGVAVTGPSSGAKAGASFRASVRFLRPPLPHPGRRDFPSPVGNEDLSRRDLPKRGTGLSRGVHAPVPSAVCRGVRRVQRFLPTTGGFIMPPRPRRASRPSSPRAPLLQERYPLSSLNMGPCADPDAPRLHFSFRPYRRRPRRLRHPRLVIGTVPTFGPALLSWSAASPAPAARQVHVTSSFP